MQLPSEHVLATAGPQCFKDHIVHVGPQPSGEADLEQGGGFQGRSLCGSDGKGYLWLLARPKHPVSDPLTCGSCRKALRRIRKAKA